MSFLEIDFIGDILCHLKSTTSIFCFFDFSIYIWPIFKCISISYRHDQCKPKYYCNNSIDPNRKYRIILIPSLRVRCDQCTKQHKQHKLVRSSYLFYIKITQNKYFIHIKFLLNDDLDLICYLLFHYYYYYCPFCYSHYLHFCSYFHQLYFFVLPALRT